MFVSDLIDQVDLPERFVDCLPEVCDVCGSPMEISANLTGLHCSNPRCGDKMVMRIRSLCNDLNVVGFGEKYIEKFLECYSVDSPMDIFGIKKGYPVPDGVPEKTFNELIDQLKSKNKMLLWEYVMFTNIPFVRTSARKIFDGFPDIHTAMKAIEEGGVLFVQKRLGLAGDENGLSVQSVKVYNALIGYKDDLVKGCDYVEIIQPSNNPEIVIVCSDQVGGRFSTKNEFYSYIKSTFGDRLQITVATSVTKKTNYLIWAGADGSVARHTNKVKAAEAYRSKGVNIPILTAEQFIAELQSL
jgi:NAD-dependent DNA ligase